MTVQSPDVLDCFLGFIYSAQDGDVTIFLFSTSTIMQFSWIRYKQGVDGQ